MPTGLLEPIRILWTRSRLERSCAWSRASLERHQARKLAVLRRFAVERSRFYAQFHKGLENRPLAELPILTKATMMETFDDLVTDRSVRLADAEEWLRGSDGTGLFQGRYVVLSTSGSTGRRGVFLFARDEWRRALANIARPLAWAGLRPSLTKPPRSAMIASRTPWHYSARVTTSLATKLLPSLHLDAGEPVETIVRRLNEWQPTVLAGYPSVLRQLTEEQMAGRLRIRPTSVATSAEVLTPETRLRVQQAWGVRVYDTYGATEYAPIAAECQYGRKHLVEDGAVIELVDERGRAVPPGEASDRVLITVFDRWTQPLIRYEISDVLRPLAGECECGRKFRLIAGIEGRIEDVLAFRSTAGTLVRLHPNLFHEVLETVPCAGWQVVQEDQSVTVNLIGVKDPAICDPLRDQLRQMFAKQGADVHRVEVRPVDALRRGATGKAPLVMSQPAPTLS